MSAPWTHWQCEECEAKMSVLAIDSDLWNTRCTDGHYHVWSLVDENGRNARQRLLDAKR